MIRIARAVSWLCLVLILIGIGGMVRANSNIVRAIHFAPMLPFALALFTYYSRPTAALIWTAIGTNSLMAIVGSLLVALSFFPRMAVPTAGTMVGITFIVLAGINLIALQVCRQTLKRDSAPAG